MKSFSRNYLKVLFLIFWLKVFAAQDPDILRTRVWNMTLGNFTPRPKLTDKPREIKLKIHLWEYVERVKGLKLDKWQINFCNRLEESFLNRVNKVTQAAIAVPPQHGKSVIISQAYLSWMIGHDPMHRVVLACYNLERSRKHLQAVISILRGPAHKAIFNDPQGYIPNVVSDKSFSCFARLHNFDGQHNFTAVSLQTGLVGIGFDTLVIDDPYKTAKEAMSPTYRESSWNFYQDTAQMRGGDYGNIFIMFHRYHQDDLGGRALNTKEFDYWFYAAEYVGPYKHDDTGLVYEDSYPREHGEFLSERRSPAFYERQKRIPSVWNSQFQQRPVGADGNKFDISKIKRLTEKPDRSEFLYLIRSWDNAATEDGGDFSVGTLTGFRADESACVLEEARGQWNSGDRIRIQKETAERDGKMVIITHPVDPGNAGKDVAFQFQQMLQEYIVELLPTTENKDIRAHPYSVAVNQGKYSIVEDEFTQDWLNEHKFFPVGTYKDRIDSAGDGYRVGMNKLKRGLVVKSFDQKRNIISWSQFRNKFGDGVPAHWQIYAAIQVNQDESLPSGAVLVARAAKNAFIGETVFVIATYKQLSGNLQSLTNWLKEQIKIHVRPHLVRGKTVEKEIPLLWLSDKSSDEMTTALRKLKVRLRLFDGDAETGLSEMNWYFNSEPNQTNPFVSSQSGTHLYLVVDDKELNDPQTEKGLVSLQQELVTWTYNSKSQPQEFGGVVANCLKMILADFKPQATEFTVEEKIELALPEELQVKNIAAVDDKQEKINRMTARRVEYDQIKKKIGKKFSRNPLNKLRKR